MAGPDQQNWSSELQGMAQEAGLSDRVHWPGMLTGYAKWGAFYASEAFVLPSHQENFGIAVAEALGCGRGVLLSDKVNIAAQIVADGAGGSAHGEIASAMVVDHVRAEVASKTVGKDDERMLESLLHGAQNRLRDAIDANARASATDRCRSTLIATRRSRSGSYAEYATPSGPSPTTSITK